MIGSEQMRQFEEWLEEHRDKLKFVVSSVPFVAQVRASSDEGRAFDKSKPGEASRDKWSGKSFREQRESLIDFIHDRRIRKLVFLAGDMHCCYHATMRIGPAFDCSTIHELGGGPIYQLRTGRRSHFFSLFKNETKVGGCDYRSQIEQVHGGASAAMHIRVGSTEKMHEIDWEVVRTIDERRTKSSPMSGCIILD